jgi:hypothetical protein
MSRKLNPASAALAFAFLLLATLSAAAQDERRVPVEIAPPDRAPGRAVLGCCKCLGGTNTLDLSTVSTNAWTVNGNPVAFLTATHPSWNINPGPARWVSTTAAGGTGSLPAGTYEYRLNFVVPACTIEQRVTLAGNFGGDDDVDLFLDNATGPAIPQNQFFLAQCAGGWCFNTPRQTLRTFSRAVTPGPHTLIVRVKNGIGPSGMFVNATLSGACRN